MKFVVEKQKEGKYLRITEGTSKEIRQIESWLARYKENWQFDPSVRMGMWDGKKRFMSGAKCRVGLWGQVQRACKKYGFDFIVENKEEMPLLDVNKEDFYQWAETFFSDRTVKGSDDEFFPYDYQLLAAYKILKYGHTISEVATGGGKTLITSIALLYLLSNIDPDAKILIVVPSILLVNQFYDDLLDYNLGYNRENKTPIDVRPTEIMSDKPRVHENPNVFIATYQSLDAMDVKFFKQFTDVVVDEAHGAGAKTLKKILRRCTFARIKAGVSGTFPHEDSMEILEIEQHLGPKVSVVSASKLIDEGRLSTLKIQTLILNHNDKEFNNRIRALKSAANGTEILLQERKYIQESEYRNDFILRKIIGRVKSNSLLLFYNIEFGQQLYEKAREMFSDRDIYYIDGEIKAADRQDIKRVMETIDPERPKILIATYGTLSTGVSIKAIFNIVFLDSFKSFKVVRQSIGRGLRLHSKKDNLSVIDIVDVYENPKITRFKNIFWKHWETRKKIYEEQTYPYTEKWIDLG